MRLAYTASWASALLLTFAAACGDSSGDSDKSGSGSDDGGDGLGGDSSGSGNGSTNSGSGAGSGSDSGSSSGNDIGKACASTDQDARLTQANLLFVVDRSGSMLCNAPNLIPNDPDVDCTKSLTQDPQQPTKWEQTQQAISGALDSLIGAENVHVGLTVFPKPDPIEQCFVSTSPDIGIKKLTSSHKNDIDTFLKAVAPKGATPIAGAGLTSYDYLSEKLVAGDLAGNTFVVLFTDGAETCNIGDKSGPFTQFLSTDVDNATKFNIRTFVIGAPGSESARSSLSEIAFEGLTGSTDKCSHGDADSSVGDCHFDMTGSDDFIGDLTKALTSITNDKSLSCVYDVPTGAAVDLNKVNVSYTPEKGESIDILKDDSVGCDEGANGWQYTDSSSKIVLCGEICDKVQEQDGLVSIVLGCPTEVVVR